ncbi:MAG: gamma-glutamylcyclotransferase family protein [Pseudomonadota bacterium]
MGFIREGPRRWRRAIGALALLLVVFVVSINLYIQLPALEPTGGASSPPLASSESPSSESKLRGSKLPESKPTDSASTVGYFAYGSNMNQRYFTRARGIVPARSQAASLRDYRVVFNLPGLTDLEPSFANLAFSDGANAYGVLHEMSEADLRAVVGSEGASYRVIEVSVELENGTTAPAVTLYSTSIDNNLQAPSRRYLTLLHDAARDRGFPAEAIQKYDPERGTYVPVLSEILGALVHTFIWVAARL